MKLTLKTMMAMAAFASMGLTSLEANAAGCLKGAAAGALAGHVAGKHAVLGAAGGCIVGRHMANKKKKKESISSAKGL